MSHKLIARTTSFVAASALIFTCAGTSAALAEDRAPSPVTAAASTRNATAIPALPTAPADKAAAESTRQQMLAATGTTKYQYGQPIPMGPHANFTPYWWGMQFRLDAKAAADLQAALQTGKSLSDIVKLLTDLGVPMAPVVATVIKGIILVLQLAADAVSKATTADGLIINSLWLPIPWVAKPTGPFVPATPLPK